MRHSDTVSILCPCLDQACLYSDHCRLRSAIVREQRVVTFLCAHSHFKHLFAMESTEPDVPSALQGLLTGDAKPDCVLIFSDGGQPLFIHSLLLQLASPVMHEAVICAMDKKSDTTIPVSGSRAAWIQMATRFYPLMHNPVNDTLVRRLASPRKRVDLGTSVLLILVLWRCPCGGRACLVEIRIVPQLDTHLS